MKYFFLLLLIILLILPNYLKASNNLKSFINNFFDYENIKKLKSIKTQYLITSGNKNSIENISYTIDNSSEKKFITIHENANGTLCTSYYLTNFSYNLIEGYTKTKYISKIENTKYEETYIYKDNFVYYSTIKKNNKTELEQFSADTIRLLELLTFAKLENLKVIKASGFIVPGNKKVPFIFKFIKEEAITINGKKYNCLLYYGEIDGILNKPAKLIFGDIKIWLLKEFPHIRIKAEYYKKIFNIIDFDIKYFDHDLFSKNS